MPEIRFDDQVVAVTGAGGGLGKAYALELAKRGAKVVVNDLGGSVKGDGNNNRIAQAVVDEIRAAGGEAVAHFDSVATWEGGQSVVTQALDTWGRLDALIANAGIHHDTPFENQTHAAIDRMLDVNLRGTMTVVHAAFRAMKESGRGGRIVTTSSPAGLFGNVGGAPYSTAKGGVFGLTRALALEGRACNIAVNTICPGAMTRMAPGYEGESAPASNFLTAGEVAPMVLYLAHRDCPAEGGVFLAMGGWFARIAVTLGQGIVVPRGDNTVETVRDRWHEITDVQGAMEITDGVDGLGPLIATKLMGG